MLACIPDVLSADDLTVVRAGLEQGAFVDGKATAGIRAKRVKHNEQLSRNFPCRARLNELIVERLRGHPLVQRFALPKRVNTPLFSRYQPGMQYGLHVDDALMGDGLRTDLSVTVFLSELADYEGGELQIAGGCGVQAVRLPAGAAVIYPAGTQHRVLPVTAGVRLAAVTWIQSRVRTPAHREILYDLDQVRRRLAEIDAAGEETDLAFKTYANLLREWSE